MSRPSHALGFETGGPSNHNGVLVEANIDSFSLYVFDDAATADRVAALARPAVASAARHGAARARAEGNPDAEPGITSVTVLGRAVLVYIAGTTFGSGEPIAAGQLAAVRSCLHHNGLA